MEFRIVQSFLQERYYTEVSMMQHSHESDSLTYPKMPAAKYTKKKPPVPISRSNCADTTIWAIIFKIMWMNPACKKIGVIKLWEGVRDVKRTRKACARTGTIG